jgi:hypothetical protein
MPIKRANKRVKLSADGHFIEKFTRNHRGEALFFSQRDTQILSKSEQISQNECKNKIKAGLQLLKVKAPHYYGFFNLFKKKIIIKKTEADVAASANFQENVIEIGERWLQRNRDATIAGALIHETIHFWQWQSEIPCKKLDNGELVWTNEQACELEAFKHEKAVLQLIGGTDEEIQLITRERGTHWQAPQYYARTYIKK